MDDVEYILKIILKARDEMAVVLSKARKELRGFAKDSDTMNTAVTNLNQAMKNFDTNMEGVTKKLEGWRAILKDAGGESKKTTKSIDDLGKSVDKTAKSTKQAADTQKQLQDRARSLRQEIKAVTEAHENEAISAKFAASEYDKLGKKLEAISLKMSDAARKRTPAQNWATDAREAAKQINLTDKRITEDAKTERLKREQGAQEAERIRLTNVKRHNADVEKEILAQIGRQEEAEKRRVAMVKLSNAAIAREIDQQINDELAASKDAAKEKDRIIADAEKRRVAMVKLGNAQIAREIEQQIKVEEQAAKERFNINRRWDELQVKARERTNQSERLGRQSRRVGADTDPSEIKRLAAEYDKLGRSYRAGSDRAREFGAEAERLRTSIRGTSSDTEKSTSVFESLNKALSKSHGSAAGFDNQLRGMGILAAVASIDQLISAAIALGGELVSLAGSAVMAGGALGGILAAGAAQALPVVGLLAGAFSRVKSVIDAVQQSQKLQQAQFTDAEKGTQKAVDKTNALANAQDTQTEAQNRLAESRKALTQAQADGARQLEDLIYQEKAAALAAKGSSLNVKEAQKALQDAVRGGASALEIQQRQQSLDEARQGAGRARVTATRATEDRRAVGGKISNLDSVKSAAKSVDDAERAVTRANRGLDEAANKADRAAGSTMTAAANLNFLLSQLSPAERRLYEAGTHLYDAYKKIFQGTGTGGSGIYGVIIDSFTRAVEKVERIMEMPKVINGIQGLANVIGKNIDKIVAAVDPAVIDQLLSIIKDSGKNLGPLVDMAIKLAKAFLNIAETANPAFQELIKYVRPLVDKFLALTANKDKMEDFFKTGEEHLESWLDLLLAVIGLFAALTGASADSGKKSIEDLTKSVKGWTDWIDSHHDQVVGFFEDARKAAYAIGGVLENIVVILARSFSAERVEKFAGILNDIVVPALGQFIDFMGELTDLADKALQKPFFADVAKLAIAFLFLAKVAGPIVGVFAGAIKSLLGLGKGIADVTKFFFEFDKNIAKLVTSLTKMGGIFANLARMVPFIFGPWGLLIAAVVVGVVLLLNHFGKLDDIWNAIKETAAGFMKDITPALKSLGDALSNAGIKINSMKDVVAVLEVIGKHLADFISTYLIESIKALGKVVAGVAIFIIRTITGVINIVHGFADIIIGIVKLIAAVFGFGDKSEAGKQILAGFENLTKGILDIVAGIIEGIIKVFEGLIGVILTPFKAAWAAVKDFFGVKSPSKKARELGHSIIEGIKDGLVGLAKWLTAPWRRAWNAVNDFFGGKPKKLAESIMDEFVDRMRVLWRRLRNAASYLWDKFKEGFDAAKHFGSTIVNAIVDGVKGLPAALLKAITDIGSQLIDVGKSIGGKIVEGVKSVAGDIKGLFGGGDDKDKPKAAATAAPQRPTVSFDIGVGAIPFGAKDLKDAQNIYGEFWKQLRKTASTSTDYIQRQFREMRIATTNSSDKMYTGIRGSLRDIQNSFKVRGNAATENWAKTWLDFQKVAYDGLNYIGHETNQALKGFGAKHIDFGLSVPTGGGKGGEGKAVGGWIGNQGERGRDTVPAWLGRGEAVLNWAHQRVVEPAMNAMYGFGLDGLFSGTRAFHATPTNINGRGFAEGGKSGTHLSRLIAAANRVDAMHLPYVWGGGHTQPAEIGSGMDCSGSVSYVVQQAGYKVPTVTSGNMPSWGFKPGGDGATVFYNPEHTFMRIGQKFFGTTGFGHPGWTGAGWFTQTPTASYLDNFAQIHLPGITDVGNFAVGVGGEIAKLIVKGSKGAAKELMQKAFDKVVPSANKYIGEQSSQFGAGSGQWGDAKTVPAGAKNIFKFFRSHDFTDEQSAGWIGNLTQESGLNPGIIQPNGEGHGLAQWGHGRFDALVAFAKAHGTGDWRDLGTQLQYILYELSGSESAAGAAIHAARTVQEAVDAIGLKYERFGVAGNRSGPAEAAFRRFGGKFAEGGTVPGPDGAPTPILAHAGEWVLNKGQQLRAAMLSGLSIPGLKSMLGFHGGPTGFQGGGEIGGNARILGVGDSLAVGIQDALKNTFKHLKDSVKEGISSGEALRRLKENWKSAYRAVIFDAGTNDAQSKTFARNLKRAHKLVDSDQEFIVSTLKGGPQAAAKNKALRKFASENENVRVVDTSGIPLGPDRLHPTAAGYRQRAQLFRQAIKSGSPADSVRLPVAPVTTLKTLMADVADNWKSITDVAKEMRKVKTDKTKKGDAKKIGDDYQKAIDLIDNITGEAGIGAIANQISINVNRAAAHLKRITYQVKGGTIKQVLSPGGILDRELATMVSTTHDLMGEKSVIVESLKAVNKKIKQIYSDKTITNKQRNDLIKQLTARRNGLLTEQDRINSEIADSIEARFNKQVEIQQNAVDAINKKHEDRATKLDLAKRVFSALGDQAGIDRINDKIAANVQGNINDLTGRLAAAKKIGNKSLADSLTKQIAELQTQVIELAQQKLRDAMDAISTAASHRVAVLDLFGRAADAMGIVGQGIQAAIPGVPGAVGTGLGAMSRAQVAQGRIDSARQEQADNVGLLGKAQAAGNIGLSKELIDKINDLTVQIIENTKAARDAKVAASAEAFDYSTSINDLNTQLIAATDAATGQTSSAELLRLANEKLALYQARTIEIQSQLDEAIREGDVKATQDLTKQLLENKIAVQNNTKAVNDITGAGSAPASYTSTAWQWFRTAILTGTGGVMPQYTPPVMADVNSIGPGGTSSTTSNGGNTINTTIEINEAGGVIDPTQIASTVVFAQSTAQ